MQKSYDLVVYDIDGTLGPSGRDFTVEQLKLVDTTDPEQFRLMDKSSFTYGPFLGVTETIEQLRGRVKQAVISNGPGIRQKNKLILMGLENTFDHLYISEEHAGKMFGVYDEIKLKSIEKPSPSMFQRMNWETKTSPEKCVYIGNTWVDYLAARNAGWDFIGVIDADEKYKDDFKSERKLKLVQQHEFNRILEHILQ